MKKEKVIMRMHTGFFKRTYIYRNKLLFIGYLKNNLPRKSHLPSTSRLSVEADLLEPFFAMRCIILRK